jgi:hypothetical protein
MCSAQVFDIARCYPPQPEGGKYPGREFVEAPEESAYAAPTTSRASTKCKHTVDVNRVEDSEDFDDHILSLEEDDHLPIRAHPLDSRPPPRAEKRVLPNFGVNAS